MNENQIYAEKLVQVYFDRQLSNFKNEEAPEELKALTSYEDKNDIVKKFSLLDREPRKISGLAMDLEKCGFNLRNSYPNNQKIEGIVLKIIGHENSTWNIGGVKYDFLEYGIEGANFILTWPKGDGKRYQIMDMEFFPENNILKMIDMLKYNGRNIGGSSFAYGSLQNAYRTLDNLAVLCFQYHHDR